MAEELKPCPFCGSEAVFDENNDGEIIIQCTNQKCGIQTGSVWPCYVCERGKLNKSCGHLINREKYIDCELTLSDIEEMLAEIWNRRVNND